MPKKRAPIFDTKPRSPAHPSLSSSGKPKDASHSLGSGNGPSGNSVNDRLQQLRIGQGSQNARVTSDVLIQGVNHSLPPPLRTILQLPDAPPPRPRPGLRVTGRLRGPAGPVPPSWLSRREHRPNAQVEVRTNGREKELSSHKRLPDSVPLNGDSLIATALKELAKNWKWHMQYDQYYLATIPVRYKEELLHFIRSYNPLGIDRAGLEVLFLDDAELEDATGAEGLTHLDLTAFVGNSLKLTELKYLFSAKKAMVSAEKEPEALPESWDAPELMAQPSGIPRFHSLTHLSISHPSTAAASWKDLLGLALHLKTLTHLSLAYWPTPTISPNSKTAYRETPQGNVNYGATNFYSAYDNDWSEAASILRRLGKSTHCLKWLDLTGCYPWVKALDRLDWFESWQALETVRICQGWIPDCFKEGADERAWHSIIHKQSTSPLEADRIGLKDQLTSWTRIETETLIIESTINARISFDTQGARSRDRGVQSSQEHRNRDAEWSNGSPERSSVRYRSSRVIFDRGWNAWWIRNAIEEIGLTVRPT